MVANVRRTWAWIVFAAGLACLGLMECGGEEKLRQEAKEMLAACCVTGQEFLVCTREDSTEGARISLLRSRGDQAWEAVCTFPVDEGYRDLHGQSGQSRILVGWFDAKGAFWLLRGADKDCRPLAVRLMPKAVRGASRWWVVDTPRSQLLVLLVYEQSVSPKGMPDGMREVEVLYVYRLNGTEAEMLARLALGEEKDGLTGSVEHCGASKNGFLVWQGTRPIGGQILETPCTLRVAEWNGGDTLQWRQVYTGNYPLATEGDPTDGTVLLVKEWKGPEDGSSIAILVRAGDPAMEVFGTTPFRSLARLSRCNQEEIGWLASTWDGASIRMAPIDKRGDLLPVKTVEARSLIEYRLIEAGGTVFLVGLSRKGVSVKKVGVVRDW
jgi:hypothetical protein